MPTKVMSLPRKAGAPIDFEHEVTGTDQFDGTQTFVAAHGMIVQFFTTKPTTTEITARQKVSEENSPQLWESDGGLNGKDGDILGPFTLNQGDEIILNSSVGTGTKKVCCRILERWHQ